MLLVVADIFRVTGKDFASTEYPSCLIERRPEGLTDVLYRIDPKAIN